MCRHSIPRMLRLYWTASLRLLNGCFVLSGSKPVGKVSFPENFNVKISLLPSTGSLLLWYNMTGRFCLAGNARGGCVPAAGGPTSDGALLLARLSFLVFINISSMPLIKQIQKI